MEMVKKKKAVKLREHTPDSEGGGQGKTPRGQTVADAALAGGEAVTVTELTANEYDRMLKGRIRELEAVMEKYCHCRHASINCFCTVEARAVMFKER